MKKKNRNRKKKSEIRSRELKKGTEEIYVIHMTQAYDSTKCHIDCMKDRITKRGKVMEVRKHDSFLCKVV